MKNLLFASVIVGGIYLARKWTINSSALDNLVTKIKGISNIGVSNGNINLKLDLNITNLSNFNLDVDTYNVLTIKKLRFFNAQNRMLIGEANVNISNLQIPSKQSLILAGIKVAIPTNNLLKHLSLFNGNAAKNVKVVLVFNAAGKEFEINPEKFV